MMDKDITLNTLLEKGTVLHDKLQEALVFSGKFYQSDAAMIIKEMVKEGLVEEVSPGAYRRKKM